MEELERKEDQGKQIPKFVHSTVPSLRSHQNTMTVSNSNLYTSKINEAQVCVGKSCFSKPESPACKTKELRDNSKKVELQEENNQDIYVPRFFIPPIQIISIGHAVDVEHAEIKSINEAQVCVDDSFLLKSESPDSESKEMGNMGIERSIASDKKCGPDKDAFRTYDGLKKSEWYTMTEELAMTESMERSNESSSESSSLHLKNRRRCASLRQKYEIHEMPKRKTQNFQPRKRAGKQPPLLEPHSAPSITDPPEVQMNLALELSQTIPGSSYTLGAQASPPLELLPPHQLQDLAERISVILKDRWGPQSHEEGKPTASGGTFNTIRVRPNIPLTQDTLKYYFENTRKSGGGDIESLTIIKGTEMEVEEVLITFAESKYAMNCLQQQHIIDKKTLNVQKYDPNDPSLWEMDKALVTDKPTGSEGTFDTIRVTLKQPLTQDTLENYFENRRKSGEEILIP